MVGGAFIVWGITRAWQEGVAVLSTGRVAAPVVAISFAGAVGASYSWAALFPGRRSDKLLLHAAFLSSQIGKHSPLGGLGQALGQAELSTSVLSRRGASLGVIVHAIVQITAVLLVCGGMVFNAALADWWRWSGAAAAMCAAGLLLAGEQRLAHWAGKRLRVDQGEVPLRSAFHRSTLLGLIPIIAAGLSFGLLLNAIEPEMGILQSIPLFAIGWLVGYLAIPFPAGLGIREAVLVGTFGLPLTVIVAASVAQRLITLAVEGSLALVAWRFIPKGGT